MTISETVWYIARSLDGVYNINLCDSYWKTFKSVEDVRKALCDHVRQWHTEGVPYMICKETYRKFMDEDGSFVKNETIVEAVEEFVMEGCANE